MLTGFGNSHLQSTSNKTSNLHTHTNRTCKRAILPQASPPLKRNLPRETIHLALVTSVLTDLVSKIRNESLRVCFKLDGFSDHGSSTVTPGGDDSIRRYHFVIMATRNEQINLGKLDDVA